MKPNEIMRWIFIYSWLCVAAIGTLDGQRVKVDDVAVKVNDEIILRSELEGQYAAAQADGSLTSRCDLLRALVINKLLLSNAHLDSIEVTDLEVETSLTRRMDFFIAQMGSEERIEELYGKSMRAIKAEFRTLIKEQLLVERMRTRLAEDVVISPSEIRVFFNALSDADRPYYSTEVEVAQIVRYVRAGDKAKRLTLRTLMNLRHRLKKGEAFAYVARRYSMDPTVLSNEGTLGFVRRGSLAPNYEAAALKLKPGDISMPVETTYGYHLIQLIEKRGTMYNSRHILLIPEPIKEDEAKVKHELDSLKQAIIAKRMRFEEAAIKHSEDPHTSRSGGFFLNASGAKTVAVDQMDPLLFFTLDTMQIGTLSNPLSYRTPDGQLAYRILYYKRKIRPHQANLHDDYAKIREAALAAKKEKEMARAYRRMQKEAYIKCADEYATCVLFE